jgi:hypothetical protein
MSRLAVWLGAVFKPSRLRTRFEASRFHLSQEIARSGLAAID